MSVLQSEIDEQPGAIRRFLDREASNVSGIAHSLASAQFDTILIAARGTSDNAARYGQYLFGMFNRLPVALAAPSLFTVYGTPPRLERTLVIGISQSGQSPDVVSVLDEAHRQGAPTIALTNDPQSPLATSSDHHIFLGVGEERSVAATKTYTAQLAALALLSLKMADHAEALKQLQTVPDFMQRALETQPQAKLAAAMLGEHDHAVIIGRGFNYATAFETALKMKELAHVEAEPYSSADFRHGPIALADNNLPVVLISMGESFRAEMAELRADLRGQGAHLVVLSDAPDFSPAEMPIALPTGMPEWLTPLVAILPGQLLAYQLTLARGLDPDNPRTIHKVTRTY